MPYQGKRVIRRPYSLVPDAWKLGALGGEGGQRVQLPGRPVVREQPCPARPAPYRAGRAHQRPVSLHGRGHCRASLELARACLNNDRLLDGTTELTA